MAHGGFSPIFTGPNASFHFDPPSLTASGTDQADVEPAIQMLLYGVAGPQLGVKAGLTLNADSTQNPWWKLTAPVSVDASLTASILGRELDSGTLTLYQHTFDIADAGGPFTGIATVSVTKPGDQTSTVGTAVSLQINASDTDGGALSYRATGLPPGLAINPGTGLISGVPTTAEAASVTVIATDASGPSGSISFSWTITNGSTGSAGSAGPRGISAGYGVSCALMASGQLNCWGDNGSGQLGIGASTSPNECSGGEPCAATPTMVLGIGSAISSSSGGSPCAVLAAGTAECWGYSLDGQLGGSEDDRR